LIITNKLQLPEPIVAAVRNDSYEAGECDISITSLINPPRIVELTRQYADELQEDAADRIWILIGQSIHEILRRASTTGLTEQRLYMDIGGWRVSGQFDRIEYFREEGLLSDFKVTSVFNVKGGRIKQDWVEQLNCYAAICRANGYPIHHLEIVAILRDFRPGEARFDQDYPPHQVKVIPIERWTNEQALEFLEERVRLHKNAREGGALPLCSDKERWMQPSKWAVMKVGNKRAVRLYDAELPANIHASREDKRHYVQYRPGKYSRCEGYCSVSDYCEQWQNEQHENESE